MAVRDRTILDNTISVDQLSQNLLSLQNEVDLLSTGDKQSTKVFETELDRDTQLPNPEHGDWCYVLNSTIYNATVQYIYNSEILEWTYVGTITNVSDASTDSKGILKLSGDLSGTASSPTLKKIITGGIYAFGNNTVTVNEKGLVSNIITGTTSYEWSFASKPNTRTQDTTILTVPSYDIENATLQFFYNGLLISPNEYDRTNSTTLTTHFPIRIDDDIFVLNLKFIGKIDSSVIINDLSLSGATTYSSNKFNADFAKLNDSILPQINNTLKIGDASHVYDSITLVNAPVITSDPRHKRNIEPLQVNALEFLNSIDSYQYQLLDTGKRIHTGVLSTNVKETLDKFGVDYAMYVKDIETGEEAIRYDELISVLIKGLSQVTPWYKKLYYRIKRYFKRKKVVGNE